MENDTDWELVGFVSASSHRRNVMERLNDGPARTSTIAEHAQMEQTHVSSTLNELRDAGLVSLLVPEEQRKGRIYGLTEKGHEVFERVKDEQ